MGNILCCQAVSSSESSSETHEMNDLTAPKQSEFYWNFTPQVPRASDVQNNK